MRQTSSTSTVTALAWQSRLILLLVLTPAVFYALFSAMRLPPTALAWALTLSLGFAALVFLLRAAGPGAALLGALLAFCFAVTPSYPHSTLWVLLVTLVLTLGASRAGSAQKAAAAPEGKHGRTAAQVAANLGIAALCGTLLNAQGMLLAHAAMSAALAETAADTLASELGCLAQGQPRMLLGGRRVPHGTDGALSLAGTTCGVLGAMAVSAAAAWACALPWGAALATCACALAGFLVDSFLGQLLERRGFLNNDAVNFLSNAAAAGLVLLAWR